MKTRKHTIQKQPLKTFRPDSVQFYSLAKGWYVLERVAVASLSLWLFPPTSGPLAHPLQGHCHIFLLSSSWVSFSLRAASFSVHKQSGHVPEHLTCRLLSMEPMLSPRWASLLCPSSTPQSPQTPITLAASTALPSSGNHCFTRLGHLFKCIYFYLEDNCFTILCWFLSYINVNQSSVYICSFPPEPPSHLPLLLKYT